MDRAPPRPADIAALEAPASFKAICLLCLNVRGGTLLVHLPESAKLKSDEAGPGRTLAFGDGAGPTVEMLVRDATFARRVLLHGDIGFAEGFMAGEWDTPDLSALLTFISANGDRLMRLFRGNPLSRSLNLLRHVTRANTRAGARRNIHAHYDLGNRFYSAWLDSTMTYSSARFEAPGQELSEGQLNKYRSIARCLELEPRDAVLEIGCGWGGFAEVAAREFGARVTALTISEAQKCFAEERIARAGLSENVEIRLEDYRDVRGAFDKVASIEMFEAVGEKYWPAYFGKIAEVLKPGGKAALQIITIRDDLFDVYRKRADFIQRYIFPGGMLPSVTRLREETARAGLAWRRLEAFGINYAETLAEWSRRFLSKWDEIRPLGFDEKFRQLWRFYLSYCEAGFRSGRTNVVQLALTKPC
jgi:cyclopropane-fatty-acyl-phospholipid synthase